MNRITYDNDGNPVVHRTRIVEGPKWEGNLLGIFAIDGNSYDVVLSETKLSWTPLQGSGTGPKKRPKSKKKDKHKPAEDEGLQDNCIILDKILGVQIRRLKRAHQKEGEGVCQGFGVFAYHKKSATKWRDWELTLGHPSEETCLIWMKRIRKIIRQNEERPKRLKIFTQPHAGKKQGLSIFHQKVEPLFTAAGVEFDVVELKDPEDEVNHNEHVKQEMIHIELSKYDCIVCVGGDGTTSQVMNGLLTRVQHDNNVDIRPHFGPVKSQIPLGIIPVGTINSIAHTAMGIEDATTAAIHILLGNTHPMDVASIYLEDTFHRWAFNCHYGFFGNILPFLGRYAMLGENKVNASFAKALTTSKFRSYECDISYVPSAVAGSSDPSDGVTCRQGCGVCSLDPASTDQGLVYEDKVMSLDPLNQSGNSSVLEATSEETPWKTLKGNFLSVSALTQPQLCEFAPLGLSPYTHLTDGTLDLVVVHNTDRKEFVRFLKRHGNEKNQLSFPFVESYRCQEVRFHARSRQTWNFQDLSVNEAVEATKQQQIIANHRAKKNDEVLVIDQLSSSSDEEEDGDSLRSGSIASGAHNGSKKVKGYTNQVMSIQDESEEEISEKEDEDGDPKSKKKNKKKDKKEKEKEKAKKEKESKAKEKKSSNNNTSSESSSRGGSAEGHMQEGTNTMMYVSDNYRTTLPEKDRIRRAKGRQKKSEKKKQKDTAKGRSIWNVDSEMDIEQDMVFRVHQGLVLMCGQGIPKEYDPDEVKHGCLGIF